MSKHKWALDIVRGVYEFDGYRWVLVNARVFHADPDQRWR